MVGSDEKAIYEIERALQKLRILEHSLGNKTFYRNHFAASSDHAEYELIVELVAAGYMVQGKPIPDTDMHYYHVTEKGKTIAFCGAE